MPFAKGQSGNPKGRKRGQPNRVTREAREVFKAIFDRLAPKVEGWIRKTAETDPAKAADLLLRIAEHFIPKLQRLTVDLTKIPIEEIAAELARREREENIRELS